MIKLPKKFPVSNHETRLKEYIKFQVKQNLIYEGLIYSYPTSIIFTRLLNMGYRQEQLGLEKSSNGQVFLITFFLGNNANSRFEELNKFMINMCGWNISSMKGQNGEKLSIDTDLSNLTYQYIWLQYEPKFDIEISERDYPTFVYHITPEKNLNKILTKGLCPSSKSRKFNYSERVYFAKNIEDVLHLSKEFIKKGDKDDLGYVVLKINIAAYYFHPRIFRDPNFKNGFYTLENISPYIIKSILKIKLDNNGNVINKEEI